MTEKGNMDQAIEELIKIRVKEVVDEKDKEIRVLQERNSILEYKGTNYVTEQEYTFYGKQLVRTFTLSDSALIHKLNKYKQTLDKDKEDKLTALKQDLVREYENLKKSLELPWYMKIIVILKEKYRPVVCSYINY
jgi:histone acetyltransferase (RNA polymerase elongator complex component)